MVKLMPFEKIIGQKNVKEILARSLKRKRIPHALLFYGGEGVGKEAVALELARSIICQQDESFACGVCADCERISRLTHPDVIFLFPQTAAASDDEKRRIMESIAADPYMRLQLWANPSISIDQIRALKRTASMSTLENKGRVVIISDAHRMTVEAANSLLKILEEPHEGMTIILTSSQHNLLLPTIISRCQLLRFEPLSWQDIHAALMARKDIAEAKSQLAAKLSTGNFRRALALLDEDLDRKRSLVLDVLRSVIRDDLTRIEMVEQLVKGEGKKSVKDLLELMLLWFRDVMLLQDGGRDNDYLVNIDQLDTLEKFCAAFEEIDVSGIVTDVERAIQLIDRNVYLNLILINLFYKLKSNLRRVVNA